MLQRGEPATGIGFKLMRNGSKNVFFFSEYACISVILLRACDFGIESLLLGGDFNEHWLDGLGGLRHSPEVYLSTITTPVQPGMIN